MARDFKLIDLARGYISRDDPTTVASNFLVEGSKNVVVNLAGLVQRRLGYTVSGAVGNGTRSPITAAFDWQTAFGSYYNLRVFGTNLQVQLEDDTWLTIFNGLQGSNVQFATWWDNVEKREVLLFIDGSSNIYEWSGGMATFNLASSNATTIAKTGAEWFSETGFYSARDRTVIINGNEYVYTSNAGATTLTTATTPVGEADGSVIYQKVKVTANLPDANVSNNIILVSRNQVYIGSNRSRIVFVSSNIAYSNFTEPAVRDPGDPIVITLDDAPTALVEYSGSVYASAGRDMWIRFTFTLSDDLTSETLTPIPLKTSTLQAAISQNLVAKVKNDVVYISQEPVLDSLSRLEAIDTAGQEPLSSIIANDFSDYDFAGGHALYYKDVIYISVPRSGLILMYDLRRRLWQPPQTIPVSFFYVLPDGRLGGHSAADNESYILFDGLEDKGSSYESVARFSYRNYGRRDWQKSFDKWFTEGYIKVGTQLQLDLEYDYTGSKGSVSKVIDGTDTELHHSSTPLSGIGDERLGLNPLGTTYRNLGGFPKFRVVHLIEPNDYYEVLTTYRSSGVNQYWELITFGGNAVTSRTIDNKITR